IEGLSSWDMDKTTWGGQFKLFGTVPVFCRCTGRVNEGGLVLAGKLGKRVLFGWLGYWGLTGLVLQVLNSCYSGLGYLRFEEMASLVLTGLLGFRGGRGNDGLSKSDSDDSLLEKGMESSISSRSNITRTTSGIKACREALRKVPPTEVIEFGDSYEAPKDVVDTGSASKGSAKKKGRTVAVTTEDMQNKYKTAQELWAAILKTFGGNEATKKTKKNQLKQQYDNFKAEGSETLEQTFNRLQAIVSHLEFTDVEIEQDDLNQKLLTSLAPEWLTHTIV
nr:hypothetical protein [Tanacetum cinerariifolium]